MLTPHHRSISGGVVLIACGLQFAAGESIAASAWVHPTYSYTKNYISDLGVTVCGDKPVGSFGSSFTQAGQTLCSPLHQVMNTSFVLVGVLFFTGTLLLKTSLPRPVDNVQLVIAAICAICLTTVGLIHAQPQTRRAIILHVLGAFIGLLLGSVYLIRNGILSHRLHAPSWFVGISIALGAAGIISTLLVAIPNPFLTPPVFEWAATYSCVLGIVITGVTMLRGSRAVHPSRPLFSRSASWLQAGPYSLTITAKSAGA